MAVKIGHASIDENGKVNSGKAGDQNGKEVKISNYYVHSKGWVVLRCKDDAKREKIAEAMEKACKNADIGYDQYQRDTLFNNIKNSGFDPSKTTKKVETDCSALVRVCIAYAYGSDKAGNIRTISEPSALVKTGLFTKYTSAKYCKSSDYLKRGDILCTPVSGHTVVVLNDGAKVKSSTSDSSTGSTTSAKTDKKIDSVLEVQIWLNNNYATGLTPDGLYGSRTKAALVKALQKELGFTGKDIDGDYGKKTNAAVMKHNLSRGDKGNLVKVLQGLLVCNGYKGAYIDGSFGGGTETAVEQYQRKRGMKADGVAGSKTFTSLCA